MTLARGFGTWALAAMAPLLLTVACARKNVRTVPVPRVSPPAATRTPATPPSRPPTPDAKVGSVFQSGIASWYGHPYHGRRAANGEVYDMETMVAAHKTLPFQTWVRVLNVANGKTADVRIIDRGPFVGNRIIDLSHAAAQQIGLIGPGVGEVELRLISSPEAAAPGAFGVQVGAFRDRANAERSVASMKQAYGSAVMVERAGDPVMYRVVAGSEPTPEAAETLARRVRNELKLPQAFVVRVDR